MPGLRESTARGRTLGQRVGVDDGDRGVLGEDSGREEAARLPPMTTAWRGGEDWFIVACSLSGPC